MSATTPGALGSGLRGRLHLPMGYPMRRTSARLRTLPTRTLGPFAVAAALGLVAMSVPVADANFAATTVNTGSSLAAGMWVLDAVDVDIGFEHACAAMDDGTVKCWGENGNGRLGDGTTIDRSTPVTVLGPGGSGTLGDVVGVGLSKEASCAVKSDGSAWCWGRNDVGQLGDGTTTDSPTPVQVVGIGGSGFLANVTQVNGGERHTCARTSTGVGEVVCWGENDDKQLGDNTSTNRSAPVQVVGVGGGGTLGYMATIGVGRDHSCAVAIWQTAYCWGNNADGQLGIGNNVSTGSPIEVRSVGGGTALGGIRVISGGDGSTCANTYQYAACWGRNDAGQLGNGTTTSTNLPVFVNDVGGGGPLLQNLDSVGAGYQASCAAKDNGSAYCWGWNSDGELGDGTTSQRLSPVQVVGEGGTGTLTDVAEIVPNSDPGAGDISFACARKNDGSVWCWGNNSLGSLGDGTTTSSLTPVETQT